MMSVEKKLSSIVMCLACFVSIVLATPMSHGQSDSTSVSGEITDSTGAVVPGAQIQLGSSSTNESRSTTSNSSGFYRFTDVPPGTYELVVRATAFRSETRDAIQVQASIGVQQNFSLKTGDVQDMVTVSASANTIQTETATVGKLIESKQITSTQLNGRDPLYLAQLEPGVTRAASISTFGFSLDNSININGSQSSDNLITFDGAPMVRTRGNGSPIAVADVDSLAQVQVLTTNFLPEYGRSNGGQIRLVPKSGTAIFHGTAYEYLRNSFFNANTWSRKDSGVPAIADHPSAFRYNQFGFNINGPVVLPGFNSRKRLLFFMFGQEYLRYAQGVTTTAKVPTELMRNGDFSELLSPSNSFYGSAVIIRNPTSGIAYPNNIIPGPQLSPNGIGLLKVFPTPNAVNPQYNWTAQGNFLQTQRKDTATVDFTPSEHHQLRFSLLNYTWNIDEPFYGAFAIAPWRIAFHPDFIATLHYSWIPSATVVNEAVISTSLNKYSIAPTSTSLLDRTQYGITYPYLYSAGNKVIPNKIPTINVGSFTTADPAGPYPSHASGPIYDFSDTITKTLGQHLIKMGVLYERAGQNDDDQIQAQPFPGSSNNENGTVTFSDTRSGRPSSGAAIANAALGLFDTYGEIGNTSYTPYRGNMYEYFAQDQWKVTPRLLVEYGIRHTFLQPYYSLWNNLSVFDPRSYSPTLAPAVDPLTGFTSGGDPLNGVVIPGSGFPDSAKGHVPDAILNGGYQRLFRGYGRSYATTKLSDVQPRLGFAYSPTSRFVVRGGVGRFFTRPAVSDAVHLGGNAPFQPQSVVSFGSIDSPGGSGGQTHTYPTFFSSEAGDLPNPQAWGWNLTTEQQLSESTVFTLSYVGRRGLHLVRVENLNQLTPGSLQANPNVVAADALRPYKGYAQIDQLSYNNSSSYHALQANVTRRFSHGFLFGAAFTWAKSMDYGSTYYGVLPNTYDPGGNYGPSDYDVRNALVINYVYDVPTPQALKGGFGSSIFGNWEISGITQAQSGTPSSVSIANDQAGVGPGSGAQYAQLVAPLERTKGVSLNGISSATWFTPNSFAEPVAGTFASRGSRNSIYGPGLQSWNIAATKTFHLVPRHDNHQLLFKAEAFNFTNHPNLDNPDTYLPSNTYGKVVSKGNTYASDRNMQFSLRYQF